MKKTEIILGGGIAGLLWHYFNPKSVIITDRIGGQFLTKFQLGPKYIHIDKYTTRFFKEIDLKPNIKKIKIGFFYDGKLHSKNTEKNRKKYFEKTRGNIKEIYYSAMSADKTEFDSYDISINKIIEKIKIEDRVLLEKVNNINLENKKIITNSTEITFDKLVSTIPLNTFLYLADRSNITNQFKSYPTTFVLSSNYKNCPFNDFKDFDYVYFSEEKYPFHRITKTEKGLVFEFKGDVIYPIINEKDRIIMKVGQLIQNDLNINFENVNFFGRYGCWKHKIKINDLLKELYENTKKNI